MLGPLLLAQPGSQRPLRQRLGRRPQSAAVSVASSPEARASSSSASSAKARAVRPAGARGRAERCRPATAGPRSRTRLRRKRSSELEGSVTATRPKAATKADVSALLRSRMGRAHGPAAGAAGPHTAEAVQPGPPQQVQQHRLGLVVGGVAHHHPLGEGSVASGPGTRFQVRPRRHRHRHGLRASAQRQRRRPHHLGLIATCRPSPWSTCTAIGLGSRPPRPGPAWPRSRRLPTPRTPRTGQAGGTNSDGAGQPPQRARSGGPRVSHSTAAGRPATAQPAVNQGQAVRPRPSALDIHVRRLADLGQGRQPLGPCQSAGRGPGRRRVPPPR